MWQVSVTLCARARHAAAPGTATPQSPRTRFMAAHGSRSSLRDGSGKGSPMDRPRGRPRRSEHTCWSGRLSDPRVDRVAASDGQAHVCRARAASDFHRTSCSSRGQAPARGSVYSAWSRTAIQAVQWDPETTAETVLPSPHPAHAALAPSSRARVLTSSLALFRSPHALLEARQGRPSSSHASSSAATALRSSLVSARTQLTSSRTREDAALLGATLRCAA